jgi:chemotaxis signal transduction protein
MTLQLEDREPSARPYLTNPAYLVVTLGGASLAISLDMIREIARVPPITRVPFPPPAFLGVTSVRGAVLPVVDFGLLLFDSPAVRDGRLVIVHDRAVNAALALLVDAVPGFVGEDPEEIEPPPEVLASLPEGWIARVVVDDGDRAVPVLDLDLVLSGVNAERDGR